MKKFKNILLIILIALLIILFSANSKTVFASVKNSITLCTSSVIPALFPFFVLSELLVVVMSSTNINPTLHLFICSLLTGFPSGTINVCTQYREGIITRKQAVSLLFCTSYASPSYIISFVGICIAKSRTIGFIIFVSQLICSIICAVSFNAVKFRPVISFKTYNTTDIICRAVSGSVKNCANVCAYITFAGILADMLKESIILKLITNETAKAVIIGSIELTRGIKAIDTASISSIPFISLMVGFSGVSVIFQCINHIKKNKLPCAPLVIGKIILSILMPFVTFTLVKIIPVSYHKPNLSLTPIIQTVFVIFVALFFYIVFDKYIKKLYNKIKKDR